MIGSEIIHLHEVDSTNNYAKSIFDHDTKDGTVITASHQTSGRGRMSRSWVSGRDMGVYMSLILRPNIDMRSSARLTIIAAVSVCKAMNELYGISAKIKWPNDIMIGDAKVCGMLTEASGELGVVNYVVVGIGINVHNKSEDFKGIDKKACSLRSAVEGTLSMRTLAAEVLSNFDGFYAEFLSDAKLSKNVLDFYRKNSFTIGNEVKLSSLGSGILEGEAVDITDEGHLIVRDGSGTKVVFSGEII